MKRIDVEHCIQCPKSKIKHLGNVKMHGGYVYCEASGKSENSKIGTFTNIIFEDLPIPDDCPLENNYRTQKEFVEKMKELTENMLGVITNEELANIRGWLEALNWVEMIE